MDNSDNSPSVLIALDKVRAKIVQQVKERMHHASDPQ